MKSDTYWVAIYANTVLNEKLDFWMVEIEAKREMLFDFFKEYCLRDLKEDLKEEFGNCTDVSDEKCFDFWLDVFTADDTVELWNYMETNNETPKIVAYWE